MPEMPHYLNAESWLLRLFSSRDAREGGVVRRKIRDIDRLVGREVFLAKMGRRSFTVIENPGQFVKFCNQELVRRVQ
jgi:hypothetical protein